MCVWGGGGGALGSITGYLWGREGGATVTSITVNMDTYICLSDNGEITRLLITSL